MYVIQTYLVEVNTCICMFVWWVPVCAFACMKHVNVCFCFIRKLGKHLNTTLCRTMVVLHTQECSCFRTTVKSLVLTCNKNAEKSQGSRDTVSGVICLCIDSCCFSCLTVHCSMTTCAAFIHHSFVEYKATLADIFCTGSCKQYDEHSPARLSYYYCGLLQCTWACGPLPEFRV